MPTESAFLLAGLLFIAAALGYVFARFGDADEDEDRPGTLNSDYLKGLNHILNEEPDRAVEVFMRIAELDEDAFETHFALGALFRKRGEVDRAIRVHEQLIARPALTPAQKNQAEAELAEDFLSAGLFDRAESMFLTLCDSSEYRALALERLRRIYEVTRDWERAVEISHELDKLRIGKPDPDKDMARVAHYFCEMAEEAWQQNDLLKAQAMLRKAVSGRGHTVRSLMVRADIFRESGEPDAAIALYREAIRSSPELLIEVLPRLAASHRDAGREEELSAYLGELLEKDDSSLAAIAMSTVRDPSIDNRVSMEALQRFVSGDRILKHLVGAGRFEAADEAQRLAALDQIRDALRKIVASRPGFVCRQCGYACQIMQWQCPGCHAWESIRPIFRISLTGSS